MFHPSYYFVQTITAKEFVETNLNLVYKYDDIKK